MSPGSLTASGRSRVARGSASTSPCGWSPTVKRSSTSHRRLSARTRVFSTGQGRKTDATDAHSVALVGTRMAGLRPVVADEQLEVLRLLVDRRRSLGDEHTRKTSPVATVYGPAWSRAAGTGRQLRRHTDNLLVVGDKPDRDVLADAGTAIDRPDSIRPVGRRSAAPRRIPRRRWPTGAIEDRLVSGHHLDGCRPPERSIPMMACCCCCVQVSSDVSLSLTLEAPRRRRPDESHTTSVGASSHNLDSTPGPARRVTQTSLHGGR